MKLHRYLFQRFIPVFLGSLGFFSPVLILVDLLMNLTSYIQNNAAAIDVARVILLYLLAELVKKRKYQKENH